MISGWILYLHQRWRAARSTLLVGATMTLLFVALFGIDKWRRAVGANEKITALAQGRDVDADPDSGTELTLARIAFLTARGDLDRSRVLLEALDRESDATLRARGHYLLANGLLRKALGQLEASQLEAAIPLVNLAKREYRRALELAPDDWDAKFNFDVAARLVRDFPEYEKKTGDELTANPKKLWTDVPGKPKGLP
jgi:mxaK protein